MNSNHVKHASTDHPILEVLAHRWSPYVYAPRPVERKKLLTCLEAARWAPSSYNEQPWSFLIAEREDEEAFRTMLDCLVEANQAWAANAGVLLLTVAAKNFSRNGKPNAVAEHDIGLAAGKLTAQATALGLAVHQMAGIDREKVRQTYNVPATHAPLTAIAIGYAGDASHARDAQFVERDATPRSRKPLAEIVFHGTWNRPASLD